MLRLIKKDDEVIIVADTDRQQHQQRFIQNVSTIKRHCRKVKIILQNKNFEDELCFSCSCKQKKLFETFNASGVDEFKNQFIKEKRLDDKLKTLDHDINTMWTRGESICPHELKSDLVSIKELEKYQRP